MNMIHTLFSKGISRDTPSQKKKVAHKKPFCQKEPTEEMTSTAKLNHG